MAERELPGVEGNKTVEHPSFVKSTTEGGRNPGPSDLIGITETLANQTAARPIAAKHLSTIAEHLGYPLSQPGGEGACSNEWR